MTEHDDTKTSTDGWLSFLDKLALLQKEAERRGLRDIVQSTKDTAVAISQRLKSTAH